MKNSTNCFRDYTSVILTGFVNHAIPLLILLLFAVLTYGEVLTHTFLVGWDDPGYITHNPAIQGITWHNLKLAFTSQFVSNYAPVQIVSYMLDYTIWGLNPFGFLFANLFYHSLSSVLLYFILVRHGYWKWGAALAALVFLVHPVQVESVAWMSQRKNLLAMFFYLLAFHAWTSYRMRSGSRARKWYVIALILSVLSLLAKSVAIIFPLMLILYDQLVVPVPRRLREHADKIPFLIAAAIVGFVTIIIQGPDAAGGRAGYPDNAMITLPMTMLPVLVNYLRILLWPEPSSLSAIYSILTKTKIDEEVVLALVILAGLSGIGFWLCKRSRSSLFWYSLFFLGLLPVSQIIPLVTRMNERYLYFPMLGVAGLICISSSELWSRLHSNLVRIVVAGCALSVAVTLSVASHTRGKVWKDTITLFSDMVEKVPDQYITWDGLAEGYRAAGDMETALQYYEMASKYGLLREIELYHLAQIYLKKGEYEKAYKHIWGLILKNPKSTNIEGFRLLGEYYLLIGEYAEAEKQLLTYLDKTPDSPEGLFTLAKVYFEKQEYHKSRELFSKVLNSGGDSAELYFAIARLESKEGNIDLSLENMQKALKQGFADRELLERDKSLLHARRDPRFDRMVNIYLGKSGE